MLPEKSEWTKEQEDAGGWGWRTEVGKRRRVDEGGYFEQGLSAEGGFSKVGGEG